MRPLYAVGVPVLRRPPRFVLALAAVLGMATGQTFYCPPAGVRPPTRRSGGSIVPGGRVVAPLGDQFPTGPGSFGLGISPSGREIAITNSGPWRTSITILERVQNRWEDRQVVASALDQPPLFGRESGANDWRSVSIGLAFSGDHNIYVSEGNTGRISFFDSHDDRRRYFDINQGDFHDSYTGDLAFDFEHGILYAADQANNRVAVIDARRGLVIASVPVGRLPFAMTLSPDRQRLYVTNVGTFAYRLLPGADPQKASSTGLPFPAFGFPGAEAEKGVERKTAAGPVAVPPLGNPNADESNSLAVVDVSHPAAPKLLTFVRTGLPVGGAVQGGTSPSGVCATAKYVFVSNAGQDSIDVIDAASNKVEFNMPLRIPGLEDLRGIIPLGLAYDEKSGWLFAAESGINAVAVIDVARRRLLGHLPAGWQPTRIAIDEDNLVVVNARGEGVGGNAATTETLPWQIRFSQLHQGTLSVFPIPAPEELPAHTQFVLDANGFRPRTVPSTHPDLPPAIRHVVLIVKEGRGYDEILGDITSAGNGPVMGAAALARYGEKGFVDGRRRRVSLRDVNLTPNQHAIARKWCFSDNFYSEADGSVDGHHWLNGVYPNAWDATSALAAYGDGKDFRFDPQAAGRLAFAGRAAAVQPEDISESGTIWDHLQRHQIPFRNYGEGFELPGVAEPPGSEPTGARLFTNIPMPEALYRNTSRAYPGFNIHISDQYRATAFIREIDERFVKTGADLPGFLYIHLPNDFLGPPRPEDGYPYDQSFLADNDYALGRILQYLSHSKWWRQMAVFVTEDDAAEGYDHIDARRTLLLCASPWAKRNYVSHTNTSIPALLKTVFQLLHVPPLNLFDASAADLSDCFTSQPDFAPYSAIDVDPRVFDTAKAVK